MGISTKHFYRKDGTLTAYALACGYVQKFESEISGETVELYKDGVYHVRGMAYHVDQRKKGDEPFEWLSFATLGEAYKHYNHVKTLLKGIN